MAKEKRGRKKVNNLKTETPNEKYKRVIVPRVKKVKYELSRISRMYPQPNYNIDAESEQKVFDEITKSYNHFVEMHQKFVDGTLKAPTQKDDTFSLD